MESQRPERTDNGLVTKVVTSAEQLAHAFAVRSICFLEERGLSYKDEFDGNDYSATHFVMYAGDEPIGTSRVRWFADFAKIEATAFRAAYRNPRTLKRYGDFVFRHIARKGYAKLITVSKEEYARLWERSFGFTRVPGRAYRRIGEDTVYFELIKQLDIPQDAVTLRSDPAILVRQEGSWDVPASFG